jgi:hypothetical protein
MTDQAINADASARGHSTGAEPLSKPVESGAYKGLVAALAVAIVSAALGYLITLVDEHRKHAIQVTNTQVEKLYGPLYALSVANQRAWAEMNTRFRPGKNHYFDDKDIPTAEQVEIWRRWMKAVFMPINVKMEAAIIDNSQLLEGNKIYRVFEDLIAHIESYKATLAKWKDTDDLQNLKKRMSAENNAVIPYPERVDACIKDRLQAVLDKRDTLERHWMNFLYTEPARKFSEDCR